MAKYDELFDGQCMETLFPPQRTEDFFDALFGDAEEGSYDIALAFSGERDETLDFEFQLRQRPGKCLVCSLTYGLPKVFSRHPVINVQGLAEKIAALAGKQGQVSWKLGMTDERTDGLHVIPLSVEVA